MIVREARVFAIGAHSAINQRRKYTNEPYWRHPESVAKRIERFGGSNEMIAAAYLHDVVEDTEVTFQDLHELFPAEVVKLVSEVTDVSEAWMGNRAERKALDRAHIAMASAEGKSIKLADLIDNTESICERDPSFAKVYMEEKRLLLDVLKHPSLPALWSQANSLVEQYFDGQKSA